MARDCQSNIYLKNWNLNVDSIISYKYLKEKKLNFSHICVLDTRVWIYIPKKKRKKLDKQSWQDIYVDYKDTNQYRIYNSCTEKIQITCDVTIDMRNLFDRKTFQSRELIDDEWSQNDNNLFSNLDDYDDNKSLSFPILILPTSNLDVMGEISQQN